ncbi:hypothetical protein, partial [Marinobacterium maritimum]|uniref:hypothetical protein n=1 Tax=Marinobacterium maritimum TaxID=500162 RepID=UPI0031D02A52
MADQKQVVYEYLEALLQDSLPDDMATPEAGLDIIETEAAASEQPVSGALDEDLVVEESTAPLIADTMTA